MANRNPSGPEQNAEVGAGQEVSSVLAGKAKYVAPALIHLDGHRTEGKATVQTFEGGSNLTLPCCRVLYEFFAASSMGGKTL